MKNFLMKVKLMATTTGVALFLIVGALTAIYSQQAFAKDFAEVRLHAIPDKGKVGSAGTLHVSLSGVLSEHVNVGGQPGPESEISGATIHINGTGEGKELTVTTDEYGTYKTSVDLPPGTHEIQATYPGDATHTSDTDKTVVTVTP